MSETIETTYGSCIDLEVTYLDSDGQPIDISADEFDIRLAKPSSLTEDFEITPIIGQPGKVSLHLSSEGAKKLGFGNVNEFRIVRIGPDGCEDWTGEIGINVQ